MGVGDAAKTVFRPAEVCLKVESPLLPQVPFSNRDLLTRVGPPLRLAENSAINRT